MNKQKPNIVFLGGGTGMSNFAAQARVYRKYFGMLTFGVAATDNGQSTGHFRKQGAIAWGDGRRIIASLSPLAKAHNLNKVTNGHKNGNTLLHELWQIWEDPVQAFTQAGKLFKIVGEVLPVTPEYTHLRFHLASGRVSIGEETIPEVSLNDPIIAVEFTQPVEATAKLVDRIIGADLIVIGPGSLWTSIIASVLPTGIKEALYRARRAGSDIIYVCNVSTERGETVGYSVEKHLETLRSYTGDVISRCFVNNQVIRQDINESLLENIHHVTTSSRWIDDVKVVRDDFVDANRPLYHDAAKVMLAIAMLATQRQLHTTGS